MVPKATTTIITRLPVTKNRSAHKSAKTQYKKQPVSVTLDISRSEKSHKAKVARQNSAEIVC